MTNVTSSFVDSGPGHISGRWTWTISATDFSVTDIAGGGFGAQLRPLWWLTAYRLFEPIESPALASSQDTENILWPNSQSGGDGADRLDDGTDILQVVAAASWRDNYWQNPLRTMSTVPDIVVLPGAAVATADGLAPTVALTVVVGTATATGVGLAPAIVITIAPAAATATAEIGRAHV